MTPALRACVLREWQPLAGPAEAADSAAAAPLARLVPEVMKRLGLEQRLQQSQVFFLWPQIVGADIAQHAQPISLRHGRLMVCVDHPGWLQELSLFHKPLLLQQIQKAVGSQAVRDLVFRIG